MRRLLELLLVSVVVVACGGRIDDGTDASVDAGGGSDAKSDAIAKPDTGPGCAGLGFPCTADAQCCSGMCQSVCISPPPPPPPCKSDGTPCSSDVECCSNVCNGTCGTQIGCASTSSKQCDQCVAMNCCKEMAACSTEPACSAWLGCVQGCEQQGQSAFACAQSNGPCGLPQSTLEGSLYSCAKTFCATSCSAD